MNDIYPLWVEAAGIMIITPVNWYATSSPIKVMMDRLVCADGGNPDPTLTQGKDAELASRSSWTGGTIRGISPDGYSRSLFTAT
jgi:multimeric flavodoxin WrbA